MFFSSYSSSYLLKKLLDPRINPLDLVTAGTRQLFEVTVQATEMVSPYRRLTTLCRIVSAKVIALFDIPLSEYSYFVTLSLFATDHLLPCPLSRQHEHVNHASSRSRTQKVSKVTSDRAKTASGCSNNVQRSCQLRFPIFVLRLPLRLSRHFQALGWSVHIAADKHPEWRPPAHLDPQQRPVRNHAHHHRDPAFLGVDRR